MFTKNFKPPRSEDDFEDLCAALLKKDWNAPDTMRFGRRGQAQGGIDIVGTCNARTHGAQCKARKDELSEKDLRDAVEKAKSFPRTLHLLVIATSAPRTTELQLVILEINQRHQSEGIFTVEILFWEDINDRLNRHSDIAEQYYGSGGVDGPVPVVASGVPPISEQNENASGRFHAELDAAKEALRRFEPRVALAKLDELRSRHLDAMTPRERYRLEVNTGKAYSMLGDLKRAAPAFIAASSHQPHDAEAVALRALGLKYQGNLASAHEAAKEATTVDPNCGIAWAVWIETAPAEETVATSLTVVPAAAQATSVVAFSLARRAQSEASYDEAEDQARRAIKLDDDWDEPKLALATIILERESRRWENVAVDEVRPKDGEKVREAADLLRKLLQHPATRASASAAGQIRQNLAYALVLLGDSSAAELEIEKALESLPDDSGLIKRHARTLTERKRFDEAIALLDRAIGTQSDPDLYIALADILRQRERPGDLQRAVDVATQGLAKATLDTPHAGGDLLAELLFAYEELGDISTALKVITDAPATAVLETDRLTLTGMALRHKGDRASAIDAARRAVASMSVDTHWFSKRRVALLFMDLGQFGEALDIWKSIVPTDVMTHDTDYLFHCALKLGDDWCALERCRMLREAGVATERHADTEIDLLRKYGSYEAAAAVVRSFFGASGDANGGREVNLRVSTLGLESGRDEWLTENESELPRPEDASAYDGYLVVCVLAHLGRHPQALSYAYRLLRRFPKDKWPRLAMVVGSGIGMQHDDVPVEAPTVAVGTAVRIAEGGAGEGEWFVIENDGAPDRLLDEIRSDHPMAVASIGKKVDDKIEWSTGGPIHRGVVKEIVDARVYRLRWCMQRQQNDFPGEVVFDRFTLPRREDGEVDVDAMRDMMREQLKEKADHGNTVIGVYRDNLIPIYHFGRGFGMSEIEAIEAITRDRCAEIRCGPGPGEDAAEASKTLGQSSPVVVTASAVGTILVLDGAKLLESVRLDLVVTEGLLSRMRRDARFDKRRVAPSGTVVLIDGQPVMVPSSPDEARRRVDRLSEIVETLSRCARVVPGVALARVPSASRDRCREALGNDSAEAVAVAAELGGLIWADDVAVGVVARQFAGVHRASTPMLCAVLVEKGRIAEQEYLRICAVMHAMGYKGLNIDRRVIVRALELANWRAASTPAAEVLDILKHANAPPMLRVQIASQTLALTWRSCPNDAAGRDAVCAVLERLNVGAKDHALIKVLRRLVPGQFGLDVISAAKTVQIIDEWLGGRGPNLLLPLR